MLCFSLGGYKFEIKAVYNRDHVTEKIRKTKREEKKSLSGDLTVQA